MKPGQPQGQFAVVDTGGRRRSANTSATNAKKDVLPQLRLLAVTEQPAALDAGLVAVAGAGNATLPPAPLEPAIGAGTAELPPPAAAGTGSASAPTFPLRH